MKRWTYSSALLVLAVACATNTPKPTPEVVDEVLKPAPSTMPSLESKPVGPLPQATANLPTPTVLAPIEVKQWKTPTYVFMGTHRDLSVYHEALAHIKNHANTDEFYAYMLKKRTYFKHSPHSVAETIKLWREQLNKGDIIEVHFYTPWWKSRVVGGWDGSKINDNTKFVLNAIERAGHLLHETSHKYGHIHQGNYMNRYDNINSFPYAVGIDFEEYLHAKEAKTIAGAE